VLKVKCLLISPLTDIVQKRQNTNNIQKVISESRPCLCMKVTNKLFAKGVLNLCVSLTEAKYVKAPSIFVLLWTS
jgi:hypothetical protein